MKVLFVHDGPLFYDETGQYYEFAYHNLLERYKMESFSICFIFVNSAPLAEVKFTSSCAAVNSK